MSVRGEEVILIEHLLRDTPLFSACAEGFITELANELHVVPFAAEPILRQWQSCTYMVIVAYGSATVVINDEKVGEVEARQSVGELVLLGITDDAAVTLTPEESCSVVLVGREAFAAVKGRFPEEKQRFGHLSEKYRGSYNEGALKNACEFFRGMHEETLYALGRNLDTHFYYPGQHLITEGTEGDFMSILVQGQVSIEIKGRIVKRERRGRALNFEAADLSDSELLTTGVLVKEATTSPPCYGELGLLGLKKTRQATVIAESICQVRIMHRCIFLKIIEARGHTLKGMVPMAKYTEIVNPTRLQLGNVPLFQELRCADEFLDFLATHVEEQVFVQGQKIVLEETMDDCAMYIIVDGSAAVTIHEEKVAAMSAGDVFGERVLLGLSTTRASSVTAETTCTVKVLSRAVIVRGLELFPQERRKLLYVAFKRDQTQDGVRHSSSFTAALAQQAPDADADWKATELRVVMRAARNSPFFSSMSAGFVERLGGVSLDRIYMPGDLIIAEGSEGDSMFIMISGCAAVFTSNPKPFGQGVGNTNRGSLVGRSKARLSYLTKDNKVMEHNCQRIGVLKAGSISGEMAMLGIAQARSATIEAETICCMWEITHSAAMPIIEQFPETRQRFANAIVQNLQHTVPTRIDSLPLFKMFERKFRMLLGFYCDRTVHFPRQKVFHEGQRCEGMYIINQGKAQVALGGLPLKIVTSGSYLMVMSMLGQRKWCYCSLTAIRTCHIIIISRAAYLQAMERYPDKELNKELIRSEEQAEAEFRASTHRALTRTRVWRWLIAENGLFGGMRFGDAQKSQAKDNASVQRCFEAWSKFSLTCRKRRTEHEERMKVVDQWVEWKQQALAHRQQQDAERKNPSKDAAKAIRGKQVVGELAKDESASRLKTPRTNERALQSIYTNWRASLGISGPGPGVPGVFTGVAFQDGIGQALPALTSLSTEVRSPRSPPSTQDGAPGRKRTPRKEQPPWQDIKPLHKKEGFGLPLVSPRDTPSRMHNQPSPQNRPWSRVVRAEQPAGRLLPVQQGQQEEELLEKDLVG